MTTIAYKDGIIAYDSRASSGNTIVDDNADKHIIKDGVHFFYCGKPSEYVEMCSAYFNKDAEDFESSAIVVDKGKLFYYGLTKSDGYWKHPIPNNGVYAIGSGQDHAFTAMDLGCSAKEAVKMAMKRDSGTGGKIRTFKVR